MPVSLAFKLLIISWCLEPPDKVEGVYLPDPVSGISVVPKVQFTFTWSSGVPLTVHVNIACPPDITVPGDETFDMPGSAGVKKGQQNKHGKGLKESCTT